VRSVEMLYAFDEALRIIDRYEEPDRPAVEVAPRAGTGFGWTEAPRGMLWHRYEIDEEGTILRAQIVPPTSQNQRTVEEELHAGGDPQLRPLHLVRHALPEARGRPRLIGS
jgi:sulfhydrogenase subunit alpha